ncbi:MAG: hypothetical protein PQJ60_09090, partial [Spirochaetales bacterium]|nr:hypothetical protein [Spirochaetales bacterium]
RFCRNRILLLEKLYSMDSVSAEKYFVQSLIDKSISVRKLVQDFLMTKYNCNCREVYHSNIKEGINLTYSILGLSECGNGDDLFIIEKFLKSKDPVIRNAAIIGKYNIQEEIKFSEVSDFLYSNDVLTSRIVYKLLRGKITTKDAENICEKIESSSSENLQMNLISLLREMPKWDSIYYLIKFVDHDNKTVRTLCSLGISSWNRVYNQSYAAPTAYQLTRIKQIIELKKNQISENVVKIIQFSLDSF